MRLLLAVAAAALFGCSVPPYEIVESEDASLDADVAVTDGEADAPPDTTADGGCQSNTECAGKLDTPLCDTKTGRCVQCLDHDRCKKNEYCATDGTCKVGCRSDADCTTGGDAGVDGGDAGAVLKCDPVDHVCRGCKNDDECPLGFLCTADACRPGCSPTHGCPSGQDCCDAKCIDPKTDVKHCGACNAVCTPPAHASVSCVDAACKMGACDSGWADCKGGEADGCETDIASSLTDCGGCGVACTVANGTGVCDKGTCKVASCAAGFGDCDGDATNGCEQRLDTLSHCGGCKVACARANGVASCATGTCTLVACNPGFGDCNKNPADGCEANLAADATNCSVCGNVCPSTRGTPACIAGACKYSACASGFGDCDGSKSCATVTVNDPNNCGGCGVKCAAANATATCSGTTCTIASCNSGFRDCSGGYADGCETPINTLTSCGGCGIACARANATATCATGSCAIASCNSGFGNCDGSDANGCETNTTNTAAHCGGCGKPCSVPNGTAGCASSACTVASCNAGFANCDGSATNGCERALSAAANTCATATNLATSTGADVCGTRTQEATLAVTTFQTRFYKLRLVRCDAGACKASDPMRARITLSNPAGLAFDLRVYGASTCATPLLSSTSGTLGGTETVTFVDTTCATPRELWIEVRYRAGTGCGNATLTATGAYEPYP